MTFYKAQSAIKLTSLIFGIIFCIGFTTDAYGYDFGYPQNKSKTSIKTYIPENLPKQRQLIKKKTYSKRKKYSNKNIERPIIEKTTYERYNFENSSTKNSLNMFLHKTKKTIKNSVMTPIEQKVYDRILELKPELGLTRAFELTKYFVKYANQYNIDVKYLVHIAYIETKFVEHITRNNKMDFGIMQINWAAHHKNVKSRGITTKQELNTNDEFNIQYAAEYISGVCVGSNCNIKRLVTYYNGRNNSKYQRELRNLLTEWNS